MNLVERQVAELEGLSLRYAVAIAMGLGEEVRWAPSEISGIAMWTDDHGCYDPTTLWEITGPLIEKYGIEVFCNLSAEQATRFKDASPDWRACMNRGRSKHSFGVTPLIAACRAIVASQLGATVQIPEELT